MGGEETFVIFVSFVVRKEGLSDHEAPVLSLGNTLIKDVISNEVRNFLFLEVTRSLPSVEMTTHF
jgi:hypothetical protein